MIPIEVEVMCTLKSEWAVPRLVRSSSLGNSEIKGSRFVEGVVNKTRPLA